MLLSHFPPSIPANYLDCFESTTNLDADGVVINFYGDIEVIVEQAVVFGITVGLHSRLISGAAVVNLEFDEIKALLPVKINDTLYVSSEVASKRDLKSRPTQGLVVIKMITKNQKRSAQIY